MKFTYETDTNKYVENITFLLFLTQRTKLFFILHILGYISSKYKSTYKNFSHILFQNTYKLTWNPFFVFLNVTKKWIFNFHPSIIVGKGHFYSLSSSYKSEWLNPSVFLIFQNCYEKALEILFSSMELER